VLTRKHGGGNGGGLPCRGGGTAEFKQHLNSLDDLGCAALHYAVRYNRLEAAEWLLNLGSSVVLPDSFGEPPLCTAASTASTAMVSLLVNRGSDVNERSEFDGGTALHRAAKAGNTTMITHLLKLGAELDAPDARGRTPLSAAVAAGQRDAVLLLVDSGASPWQQV
jgi:serine/threonine-protein phosphatase 6 regulatory ankyrin repeat subunit C